MMFIQRLNLTSDILKMTQSLNHILNLYPWPEGNQIGISHRPGAKDQWLDAAGSLYNYETKKFEASESEFTQLNSNIDSYLLTQLQLLEKIQKLKLGRIRFMRLLPKTGLSVHLDTEVRYHFVLSTNSRAYISVVESQYTNSSDVPEAGKLFHMPCDGYWYKVDTRQTHFVYNGGSTERVHLVVCPR